MGKISEFTLPNTTPIQPMKEIDTRPTSSIASQVLKLVGVVLILFFLVELLTFLIFPDFANQQWQLGVITQLVERGVTPLVGFALIYTGFQLRPALGSSKVSAENSPWKNPQFWAFVVASLLGLLFLLLVPLHFSATNQASQQAIEGINQQVGQAELQLEQQQTQVRSLVESGKLDQLIQNNQVPPEQLALLQQIKQDPKALDKRAEDARSRIRTEQNQAQAKARSEASKSQLRVELRSLLLAIGYITIGWTGLREAG